MIEEEDDFYEGVAKTVGRVLDERYRKRVDKASWLAGHVIAACIAVVMVFCVMRLVYRAGQRDVLESADWQNVRGFAMNAPVSEVLCVTRFPRGGVHWWETANGKCDESVTISPITVWH